MKHPQATHDWLEMARKPENQDKECVKLGKAMLKALEKRFTELAGDVELEQAARYNTEIENIALRKQLDEANIVGVSQHQVDEMKDDYERRIKVHSLQHDVDNTRIIQLRRNNKDLIQQDREHDDALERVQAERSDKIDKLKKSNKTLDEEISRLLSSNETITSELRGEREKAANATNNLEDLKREKYNLERGKSREIADLQRELDLGKKRLAGREAALALCEKDYSRLRDAVTSKVDSETVQKDLREKDARINQLEKESQKNKQNYDTQSSIIDSLQRKIEDLEKDTGQSSSLKDRISTLSQQIKNLKDSLRKSEDNNRDLTFRLEHCETLREGELKAEMESNVHLLGEAREKRDAALANAKKLEKAAKENEYEIRGLRHSVAAASNKVDELEADIKKLRKAIDSNHYEISVLTASRNNYRLKSDACDKQKTILNEEIARLTKLATGIEAEVTRLTKEGEDREKGHNETGKQEPATSSMDQGILSKEPVDTKTKNDGENAECEAEKARLQADIDRQAKQLEKVKAKAEKRKEALKTSRAAQETLRQRMENRAQESLEQINLIAEQADEEDHRHAAERTTWEAEKAELELDCKELESLYKEGLEHDKQWEEDYKELSEKYHSILAEHESLIAEHKECTAKNAEHDQLEAKYKELREKYDKTIELNKGWLAGAEGDKKKYDELDANYQELRVRYDKAMEANNGWVVGNENDKKYIDSLAAALKICRDEGVSLKKDLERCQERGRQMNQELNDLKNWLRKEGDESGSSGRGPSGADKPPPEEREDDKEASGTGEPPIAPNGTFTRVLSGEEPTPPDSSRRGEQSRTLGGRRTPPSQLIPPATSPRNTQESRMTEDATESTSPPNYEGPQPFRESIIFAVARCDAALREMRDERAQHGFRHGDIRLSLQSAKDIWGASLLLPENDAREREYFLAKGAFLQGIAYFYGDELHRARSWFLGARSRDPDNYGADLIDAWIDRMDTEGLRKDAAYYKDPKPSGTRERKDKDSLKSQKKKKDGEDDDEDDDQSGSGGYVFSSLFRLQTTQKRRRAPSPKNDDNKRTKKEEPREHTETKDNTPEQASGSTFGSFIPSFLTRKNPDEIVTSPETKVSFEDATTEEVAQRQIAWDLAGVDEFQRAQEASSALFAEDGTKIKHEPGTQTKSKTAIVRSEVDALKPRDFSPFKNEDNSSAKMSPTTKKSEI